MNFLLSRGLPALVLVFSFCSGLAGQRALERDPALPQGALTVERIAAEADPYADSLSLRWRPDSGWAAWMHLVHPASPSGSHLPQQEILALPENPKSPAPRVLATAMQITNALRGSDAPIPPSLIDENPLDQNPNLLEDFAWSPDGGSLLLAGTHSIAWLNLASGAWQTVLTGEDPISGVSLSPDGRFIAFIRGHSLCTVAAHADSHPAAVQVVAQPPQAGILEGEPDWPYRNELHLAQAYAWSPDSARIAWLETDDRAVASYAIHPNGASEQRIAYPRPGRALPIVRVFIRPLQGGAPISVDLGPTTDGYIPRILWLPDSRHLAIEQLNRPQRKLDLYVADTATGKTRLLLTETDQYWINLSEDLRFLKDGGFLWSSERSGFRHLYRYDQQGRLIAQLTQGAWQVTRLDAVDEAGQRIYFTATEASPLERQLYSVHLDGTGLERLTLTPGTHEVRFDPAAARFADLYSDRQTPPRISIQAAAGPSQTPASAQEQPTPTDLQPIDLIPFTLHLGDKTHAFMIKPPGFDPAKKYPVIIFISGGPGEQIVRDRWGGATGLWMQLMAQKGFLIFALDNHGTFGHGHFFEEPIHLRLGAQELVDQRDGLNYLHSLPYVDASRIGLCGWGYGGYLAASAMLDRPVPYRAAFAGAPVIDWRLYDAVFAERYLEDPIIYANGWRTSSALGDGGPRSFKGPLLVAQGTEDAFVHLDQLFTLQRALVDAGKSADTLLFPGRGHSFDDSAARKLLYTRMTDFFVKNL